MEKMMESEVNLDSKWWTGSSCWDDRSDWIATQPSVGDKSYSAPAGPNLRTVCAPGDLAWRPEMMIMCHEI